jgi:class 3 adenylate cyclase
MRVVDHETCPLPEDPVLAAVAAALNDAGHWAEILDREWRGVYLTDDGRQIYGGPDGLARYPVGAHFFGPERVTEGMDWRGGLFPLEIFRNLFMTYGPWILGGTPGGREELRGLVDPRLRDIVDHLAPLDRPPAWSFMLGGLYTAAGTSVEIPTTVICLRDDTGQLVGFAIIGKPAVGMAALGRIAAMGDARHFKRMQQVAKPARRPAAVMFADLESSSPLARRLSAASYFALVRRIAWAADQSVLDAGGLVGRHAGDGVVAFFLAETGGSESAAARACITAARTIKHAVSDVAAKSDLLPADVVLRFGLHWGANLYVGQIATRGRTEITALGDQVNETARIEACATGGRALASKDLLERLAHADAAALNLDPEHVTYTALADLSTATDKVRRDAPAIAVCDV